MMMLMDWILNVTFTINEINKRELADLRSGIIR